MKQGKLHIIYQLFFQIHLKRTVNNITVLNWWLFVNMSTFEKRWPRAVDEFVNLAKFSEC
jgi:hypothetical protein